MSRLVIRGGTIVMPDGPRDADIEIEDGRIVAITAEAAAAAASADLDARGLHVFPGGVDAHVHFNEPGRTEWEGAATGSRALAAGGGTCFVDMPLNSTPCVLNAREVERKRTALEAASIADFGIWGGLVPGAVPRMAEMAANGVIGFKAFMCDSGLPEFPRADDDTLRDGLKEAARLGLPVAVHAESEEVLQRSAAGPERSRRARPVEAETEAIARAAALAGETGARLHIVHVSSGRGVAVAAEARARGVDVSIETCPHYLCFTDADVERLGAIAKCAPPLRPVAHQDELWAAVLDGTVDVIGSDHSPTEPARKAGPFAEAWGGIAGVQSTLPALLERGHHARGLSLARIAELLSAGPARRFRIAGKGVLAPGYDADLALVRLSEPFTLTADALFQRHAMSPYIGQTFRGTVRRTIRRGETIFADGHIIASAGGRFVRPLPESR
jgi:allantoinase